MEQAVTIILTSLGSIGIGAFLVLHYYNNVRNFIKDVYSFLASTFGWFKSESTKLSIETNGTKSINELNQIVPELNLPDLSIEWVKSDEHGKVRLEPGKAIVLLKYDKDNTQNIINTTAAYIQKTLLNNTKPFLDNGVRKAIDFAIIRQFLSRTPQKNFIVTQYVESCVDDIDRYGDAFSKVIKVEDEGLLTRVLLREYAIWGNKIIGRVRNSELTIESTNFLDFIFNIASREFDELTPLVFNDKTIKVAVLLVAKYDTFYEKGIEPYVRRIKEGFAKGINTFYLLARNEKIDILNEVYGEIISTGNYNLLNGPIVYKDNSGRDNICYCIEVKSDAELAKTYNTIQSNISNEEPIEVTIVDVKREELSCDYNGVNIVIPREEITSNPDLRLKCYYTNGMTIEVIPLRVIDGGKVYSSILKTNRNPEALFSNNYEVGTIVTAIVQNADDDFITLLVKDTNQECVAYRRNLTYSRFAFLHKLFPVGSSFQFKIKDINYIYNQLELEVLSLSDPWNSWNCKVGDDVNFEVFNIKESCFETELFDGVFAILPYSELSWFDDDNERLKKSIKRNTSLHGYIKRIDRAQRLVILSCKAKESPYKEYFHKLDESKRCEVKIESQNAYGLLGTADNKYRIFIPIQETFIGSNSFKFKIGKTYDVCIKDVSDRGDSLVGSFRPFIQHPLQFVKDQFSEGQVLSHLRMTRATEKGIYFALNAKPNKHTEALLLNSEVTDNCFVASVESLFNDSFTCPMILKKIDMDRNVVLLSVKDLTSQNENRIQSFKYGTEYNGIVLGKNSGLYLVLVENTWVEVPVESTSVFKTGDKIKFIKASSTTFVESSVLDKM